MAHNAYKIRANKDTKITLRVMAVLPRVLADSSMYRMDIASCTLTLSFSQESRQVVVKLCPCEAHDMLYKLDGTDICAGMIQFTKSWTSEA